MLSVEKIKFLRQLHGLTQQKVADELGCTKNYISMLENRKQEYSSDFAKRWVDAIYTLAQKKEKAQEVQKLETEVQKIISKK